MKTILVKIIKDANCVVAFNDKSWDLFLRQARVSGLLGYFYYHFERNQCLDKIPEKVYVHLSAEKQMAQAIARNAQWEVYCISKTVKHLSIPVIFLKGVAYELLQIPNLAGRIYTDVDILVPKEVLHKVEWELNTDGWINTHTTAYDQKYYRKWMHEIPPMQHIKRQTVLDVHHNILPLTAKLKPKAELLLQDAVKVSNYTDVQVLNPEDLVLHSATHLFFEGETNYHLRGLLDLDAIFRHYGQQDEFWLRLWNRASKQDLQRPLFYALRYCHNVLATPIPSSILFRMICLAPNAILLRGMDFLFMHSFEPEHTSCTSFSSKFSRIMLYLRGHSLRMPFRLLLPHLLRKSFWPAEASLKQV